MRARLDRGLREIYKTTPKTDLFFQVIGLTQNELKNSPLLETALREGKIYYANQDVKRLLIPTHKLYALVTYTTACARAPKPEGRRKGKYRYDGLIHKIGGYKVGRGVVMVPLEGLKTLTEHLEQRQINYVVRYVWA